MGAILHGAAGVTMALAWFMFFDGFQIAKNTGASEYTFVEWVPGLVAMLGFILVSFAVPEHIAGSGDDDDMLMMGGGADFADEGATMRSKFLFLIGYFCNFAGLAVAIWRIVEPYSKDDSPSAWPGIALLIQVVLIAASATLCMVGRKKVADDGLMF